MGMSFKIYSHKTWLAINVAFRSAKDDHAGKLILADS
jgi:hypothetical protein